MKTILNLLKEETSRAHQVRKKIWRWSQLLILCWFAMGATLAEAQPFAYVSNFTSNNVSVIDTSDNSVVDTVPVGSGPIGVAVTPDGAFAYVANRKSNYVSVIDTSDNSVVDTVTVESAPIGVAVTPDGAFAYVTNYTSNNVSVIDTSANTVVATVPVGNYHQGVAVTPDGAFAYVINNIFNNVSVIDTSDNSVVDTVTVESGPIGVAVTPDSAFAYVTNFDSDTVSVIDTSANTVVATVPVGSGPIGVAVTPDGAFAYVANHNSNNVSVIDTSANTVMATVPVGSLPRGVAITPDGAFAYVANSGSANVSVIDTSDNTVAATVLVGSLPWGVAITGAVNEPPNDPPIADAGDDQSEHPGTPVNLDGSGSFDPDGDYPLTYSWDIVSKPPYSTAELSDRTAVEPFFTPDIFGNYTVELVVTDSRGLSSSPDIALISTINTPPVADAGPDQAVTILNTLVELDGTESYDLDGDDIYYFWELHRPEGSSALLSDPYSPTPTFVADVHGDYVITLLVKDTWAQDSDTVMVSFDNIAPVANAGGNQSVIVEDTVVLDGSGSSDANEDPITYSWSFVSKPVGSVADFTDPTSQVTEFTADVAGNYVVSLTVNDGLVDSAPSNITVTATTRQDAVIDTLGDITYTVNNLIDPSVLKNANLANVLTNKVNAALQLIDEGDYQQALDKLENDILNKTNGCADIGEPDNNDWIEDCDAQAQVYNLVVEAIDLLQGLL
jgi:YVTN family beta-propeller protein